MQAADALDDAHSRGIMHRDFKLAGIMVKPCGQVKVSDFGLDKRSPPFRASARDHSEIARLSRRCGGKETALEREFRWRMHKWVQDLDILITALVLKVFRQ